MTRALSAAVVAGAALIAAALAYHGATAPRYAFMGSTQMPLRLDTRTGAIAVCQMLANPEGELGYTCSEARGLLSPR